VYGDAFFANRLPASCVTLSSVFGMRPLALVALLCLPLTLRAQQPTGTASTRPNGVARTFLSFGQPYGGWLLMAFDSLPANRYDYRPTPVQQSIGQIAQHLETANYGLCTMFGAEKHALSAKDSLADTIKARWPKDTLIARVRASLVFCAAAVQGLTDAQLADEFTVDTPGGPQIVLRARYLMLLITDLAEHYSQLASYMRLLGLVPPSALPRPQR
jgi:uncharacterized damage-inducible protein DinB